MSWCWTCANFLTRTLRALTCLNLVLKLVQNLFIVIRLKRVFRCHMIEIWSSFSIRNIDLNFVSFPVHLLNISALFYFIFLPHLKNVLIFILYIFLGIMLLTRAWLLYILLKECTWLQLKGLVIADMDCIRSRYSYYIVNKDN